MSSPSEPFRVQLADWQRDGADLAGVRTRVFVEEQGVAPELEWDGEDTDAVHLIARDPSGRAIGTARLLASGQIGRMAVLAEWRGRGVGAALLDAALAAALGPGRPAPFLHAQTSAEGFYARRGFRPRGAVFEEAGIPHRLMIHEPGHA
jgi:predicted GNAT family N-acyltransferase